VCYNNNVPKRYKINIEKELISMAKKMTIVEQYESIIAKVEGVLTETEIAFLQERADMHSKKNSNRKPTKVQTENEEVKDNILNSMESGKSYTVTDIQKLVGIATNQKTSALVRQLVNDNLVDRAEIKGRAYFTKVEG
jgi:hypothetical protein